MFGGLLLWSSHQDHHKRIAVHAVRASDDTDLHLPGDADGNPDRDCMHIRWYVWLLHLHAMLAVGTAVRFGGDVLPSDDGTGHQAGLHGYIPLVTELELG